MAIFFSEAYTRISQIKRLRKKKKIIARRFKSGLEAAADVFRFGFEERKTGKIKREKRVLYFCKNWFTNS